MEWFALSIVVFLILMSFFRIINSAENEKVGGYIGTIACGALFLLLMMMSKGVL